MTNTNYRAKIVGIGEVLWDLLPTGKQLGGAPANCAYQANALGAEGLVVSAVGSDELGDALLEQLAAKGMSTEHIASLQGYDTGTVTVSLSDKGIPEYTIHKDVAWDHVLMTPSLRELAQQVDAICYGSLAQRSETTRDTVQAFLRATRSDCLRVCDINLRQENVIGDSVQPLLDAATVLKLNDEELPVLARLFGLDGDIERQLRQLIGRFDLTLLALTRGAAGSVLMTQSECVETPKGKDIDIVDTIGAGDAFTAALIVSALEGLELHAISANANALAAFVCTQAGAMPDFGQPFNLPER